jgi:DnaK suppressor protein
MAQSNPRQSGIANGPYMSSRQLQYFQDKLLGWRKRLHATLNSVEEKVLSAAETSPDWIDTASAQTQAELMRVSQQRAVTMIREIDAALERIQDGSYGFCIETGDEIGIKRLLAIPTAQFSVVVQEEKEQRRRVIR